MRNMVTSQMLYDCPKIDLRHIRYTYLKQEIIKAKFLNVFRQEFQLLDRLDTNKF